MASLLWFSSPSLPLSLSLALSLSRSLTRIILYIYIFDICIYIFLISYWLTRCLLTVCRISFVIEFEHQSSSVKSRAPYRRHGDFVWCNWQFRLEFHVAVIGFNVRNCDFQSSINVSLSCVFLCLSLVITGELFVIIRVFRREFLFLFLSRRGRRGGV